MPELRSQNPGARLCSQTAKPESRRQKNCAAAGAVTPELCGCGRPETRTISTEYVRFPTAPQRDFKKTMEFSGPLVVSNQSQALITSSPSAKPQITLAVTPLCGR